MTSSVKFFYNGIKLNGVNKLIKVHYSLDLNAQTVTLYADRYNGHLPADLFPVRNETDYYTDYFDTDHATLTPEHPLYKYAVYAAAKAALRYLPKQIQMEEGRYNGSQVMVESLKARLAQLQAIEDPGQPTQADFEAIFQTNLERENARIAAEQEREQREREEALRRRNEGRQYIEQMAAEHPIREGEPVVTINWSEHPAFYSWEDGELKLSIMAAEIILTHFDQEVHADSERGDYKTSFTIEYVNASGEQDTYTGRYDLGDNDGGMIEHIRSYGRFYMEKGHYGNGNVSAEDFDTGREILRFADMLAGYTMNQFVLATAVTALDPFDVVQRATAEEYIKALGRKDERMAKVVAEKWKERGGVA